MLVHLDTSVLVDAFTGPRRSLSALRTLTTQGDVATFSTLVLYEWLRGPRTAVETQAVDDFFTRADLADFGPREAERAAALYREAKRARQRQADLAIAAYAIEQGAALWTLNPSHFEDITGLRLR